MEIPSLSQQYATCAYSDFVSSDEMRPYFDYFVHASFFPPIESFLNSNQTVKVLDIGTGNGQLSCKLLRLAEKQSDISVVAVDQSLPMLEKAIQLTKMAGIPLDSKRGITFLHHSFPSPELDDLAPFDLIMSGFVVCHVESLQGLQTFFSSISNLLSRGGMSVHILTPTNVPDGQVEIYKPNDAITFYDFAWSNETLAQVVKAAGFTSCEFLPVKVSQEGELAMGAEWKTEMESQAYYILIARK